MGAEESKPTQQGNDITGQATSIVIEEGMSRVDTMSYSVIGLSDWAGDTSMCIFRIPTVPANVEEKIFG